MCIRDRGGTNYEAALKKAGQEINTAPENAKKIVIFLTDGIPTAHGDSTLGGKTTTDKADYEGALKMCIRDSCYSGKNSN